MDSKIFTADTVRASPGPLPLGSPWASTFPKEMVINEHVSNLQGLPAACLLKHVLSTSPSSGLLVIASRARASKSLHDALLTFLFYKFNNLDSFVTFARFCLQCAAVLLGRS